MKKLITAGLFSCVILATGTALAWESGTMRQTLPGTSVPDYSKPGMHYKTDPSGGTTFRQTYPGTSVPDISKPGMRFESDGWGRTEVYPTLPGTNVRDYSKPGYVMD